MNSTSLGKAKVYFTKEDFGKMLKLKDVSNLYIGEINKDNQTVEVEVITSMDNITNNRVKYILAGDVESNTSNGKQYYLSVDIGGGDSYGVLFEKNDKSELRITSFIKICSTNVNNIADELIKSMKDLGIYDTTEIIIPNLSIEKGVIDSLKAKGFNKIIELGIEDIRYSSIYMAKVIGRKDRLYQLLSDKYSSYDLIEFIEVFKELNNTFIDVNSEGRVSLKRIDKDISINRICAIFNALNNFKYNLD